MQIEVTKEELEQIVEAVENKPSSDTAIGLLVIVTMGIMEKLPHEVVQEQMDKLKGKKLLVIDKLAPLLARLKGVLQQPTEFTAKE